MMTSAQFLENLSSGISDLIGIFFPGISWIFGYMVRSTEFKILTIILCVTSDRKLSNLSRRLFEGD